MEAQMSAIAYLGAALTFPAAVGSCGHQDGGTHDVGRDQGHRAVLVVLAKEQDPCMEEA